MEFVGVAVAVAVFAAGDVARKCCLLIRRTHISATDKEAQECERAREICIYSFRLLLVVLLTSFATHQLNMANTIHFRWPFALT